MVNGSVIEIVEKLVAGILEEMPGYFLVQVRIKPTNNIKVFLDGDNGITIDTCIKVNRRLYAMVEEQNIFPDGDFSLEVSSPGVGEPLLMLRQYKKNIGRTLIVTTNTEKIEAELIEANDVFIILSWKAREPKKVGKGKETVQKEQQIPYTEIKEAVVTVTF